MFWRTWYFNHWYEDGDQEAQHNLLSIIKNQNFVYVKYM